jgi:hypothetical protein
MSLDETGYGKALELAFALRSSRATLALNEQISQKLLLGVTRAHAIASAKGCTEVERELHDTLIDAMGRTVAQNIEDLGRETIALEKEQDA